MGKKQKKMLARILVSAVLFAAGFFLPLAGWSQLVFYLAVYAIIGWDIAVSYTHLFFPCRHRRTAVRCWRGVPPKGRVCWQLLSRAHVHSRKVRPAAEGRCV